MTVTPWGEAESLKARKLRPGPGRGPESVGQQQRERLFGATVAVVAERGYEATRVEDILVVAGVSRNAFYRHFANKRECFVATLEGIAEFARPTVLDVYDRTPGTWDQKLRAMLDVLARVIVAQPAMAQVAWVEVYAAGHPAVEVIDRLDRSIEEIARRALSDSPEHADMPREIVRAMIGGVRKMVHARVRARRTDELAALMPELFDWLQGFPAPPRPLLRPRRVPDGLTAPRVEARDARSRILAAVVELVAEEGYQGMAITDIAARAGVSLTTFYALFKGKESAFLATLADVQDRLFEATIAQAVTETDWATSASAGLHAFLGFLATDPATAHLGGIGVWSTSAAGLELRAQGLDRFSALLDGGFRQYPTTSPVAAEAIGATFDALIYSSMLSIGAERLYEIAPTGTFITLAPFVGAERACELANADPFAIGQTAS